MKFLFVKLVSQLSLVILWSFATVITSQHVSVVSLPNNESVPAVIVFGDSIVDTGNNNYINTIAKVNFLPYGKDFGGGNQPTGRFSNGLTPSDIIAAKLGVKKLLPPYLDPKLQPQDLLTGSVLSLSDQLDKFREYKNKIKETVGGNRTTTIISKSIYILCTGSNDIANTYSLSPFRRLQYDIQSYIDFMIKQATNFLKELYGLGARRIGVIGLPVLGCVPFQRTIQGGIHRECSDFENHAATLFNNKLSSQIDALKKQFPETKFVYLEIYNPLLNMIQNATKYGFEVTDKGCCGTGDFEVGFLCNRLTPHICSNTSSYIFWDSFHPTEEGYKVLCSQLLSQFPQVIPWSFAIVIISLHVSSVSLPNYESIPAVIVFGDSIVDTGNNNYINTIAKCNFLPYGRDFGGGNQPTGRFSNGLVPSDIIAAKFGVKELLPPYLDPKLQPQDLLTGVSFASGANGYDPLTSKIALVWSLSDQLDMFREYKNKIMEIVGENRTATIISKGIYILCTGSNDITNTYVFRRVEYDIQAYTDLMASQATNFLQELYGLGARRIGVVGLPVLGCVPSQRTIDGGISRACSDFENQAAVLFNNKLSSQMDALKKQFQEARLVYLDLYNPLLHLIQNPAKYGFEVIDKGCCGTGNLEVSLMCNHFVLHICSNTSNYIFWDSFHPTQAAYNDHVNMKILFEKLLSQFPQVIPWSFAIVIISLHVSSVSLPNYESIPAVIVFGDSIVDTGNNNYITTIAKCNFLPYGRDFGGGNQPTGRFSNGLTPSDIIAAKFGVKELLPPYLDPKLQPQDLLTGVSFASGASGYDPLTSKIASALSLSDQLDTFREYKNKIMEIVGENRTATIISKSIYILCTGSNDITNTYFVRGGEYDIQAYTDLMASQATNFLQELYGLGARRIGVVGLPVLGCVPSQRTLHGGIFRACSDFENEAAVLFNSKLSSQMDALKKQFQEARFVYLDLYNPVLNLIQNPAKYGFEVMDQGCCGTGKLEVGPLCNHFTLLICSNTSNYIFWDSFHPTEAAYNVVCTQVLDHKIKDFF
ncbi:GDSL esterase/lipase EXL3 [Glycine soja]